MTERAWEKLEEERRRRTKEASDMLDQVLASDDKQSPHAGHTSHHGKRTNFQLNRDERRLIDHQAQLGAKEINRTGMLPGPWPIAKRCRSARPSSAN